MAASSRLGKEWVDIVKNGLALTKHRGEGDVSVADTYLANAAALASDKRDIVLFYRDSKLTKWTALIRGPDDSPFANARFQLVISVPATYPHNPPKVRFTTKICHPNVHIKTGEICLDVLKDAWTPMWGLESICRAVIVLLGCANELSPLNCDASNLLRWGDVRGYWSLASAFVAEHAILCDGWTRPVVPASAASSS